MRVNKVNPVWVSAINLLCYVSKIRCFQGFAVLVTYSHSIVAGGLLVMS